MKAIRLLMAGLFLAFTMTSFTTNVGDDDEAAALRVSVKTLQIEVGQQLNKSQWVKHVEKTGQTNVVLLFSVDEEGIAMVDKVATHDTQLQQYLKQLFQTKAIEVHPMMSNRQLHLRVKLTAKNYY